MFRGGKHVCEASDESDNNLAERCLEKYAYFFRAMEVQLGELLGWESPGAQDVGGFDFVSLGNM